MLMCSCGSEVVLLRVYWPFIHMKKKFHQAMWWTDTLIVFNLKEKHSFVYPYNECYPMSYRLDSASNISQSPAVLAVIPVPISTATLHRFRCFHGPLTQPWQCSLVDLTQWWLPYSQIGISPCTGRAAFPSGQFKSRVSGQPWSLMGPALQLMPPAGYHGDECVLQWLCSGGDVE